MDIIVSIVVVVIFAIIPTHNKFLLGSLETYGSNWFCTIARNIDICHILILATSVLALNVSAAWVAKFTCGLNMRQEIVLLISWVIKVHIFSGLIVTSMSWWFALGTTDVRVGLIFSELLHLLLLFIPIYALLVVIGIVLQVFFRGIMTQNFLLILVY